MALVAGAPDYAGMLPGCTGEVLSKLRGRALALARPGLMDRIRHNGGISTDGLAAPSPPMSEIAALEFGPFRLLGRHGPLLREGQEIKLQPKALATLWTLVRQAGEVVTKQALMDAVWPGTVVGDDALTFQIQALRRALEDDPKSPRYLLTAHRVGFRFVLPEAPGATAGEALAPAARPEAFVGRQGELDKLLERFAQAQRGQRQLVFVGGEAGIGKSTLVNEFLAQLRQRDPDCLIGLGQCTEHQGAAEAYLPVLDALGNLLRRASDARPLELIRRAAPGWLRQLPALVPSDELASLRRQTQGASREQVLRELAEALEQLSALQPLVWVLEDLHWSDPSTLDLLAMLAQRTTPARLLIVATYRPVDAIIAAHPIRALLRSLKAARKADELLLGYLDAAAVAHYLAQRSGLAAPEPDLLQTLHARSGGHPLFMAQLYEYLAAPHRDSAREAGRDALPQALQDLIALQFAQLKPEDQALLEIASVAGMEFAAASLAACSGEAAETVERRCDHLARQGQFVLDHGLAIWPDGTSSGRYRFRHVLYEQVIRQSLSSARCARLNRQLAETLERAYGARGEEVAGELLHYYEQAGAADKIVRYSIVLARIALQRTANEELQVQAERGLQWLAQLPAGASRDESELALRGLAAVALQARHGNHADAVQEHRPALERLLKTVQNPALVELAYGVLWRLLHYRDELQAAAVLAQGISDWGRARELPLFEAYGQGTAALTLNIMARHPQARAAALQGIEAAERLLRAQPALLAVEPSCTSYSGYALASWYLGQPETAWDAASQSRAMGLLIGNPYALCMIEAGVIGNLLMLGRDWQALRRHAQEVLQLCERHGHEDGCQYGRQHLLIADCFLGEPTRAAPALFEFMEQERASGQVSHNPIGGYAYVADALLDSGSLDLAQRAITLALQLVAQRGLLAWEPEVLRLQAELLLRQNRRKTGAAEELLQRALALCRERHSRMLELRAARSLAKLWASGRRGAEARALLNEVYAGFSEGFDTVDLREAREQLASLQS